MFLLFRYCKERGHSIVIDVYDKEMLNYILDKSHVIIQPVGSFPIDVT
jgi:hypothetical protein